MKINEVAKCTGVTVRTLHYYDQIGLLKPDAVTENGYRVYSAGNLGQLQQILFFRELGFPLGEIRGIMAQPGYDRTEALKNHRSLLQKKRTRLNGLIALLDNILDENNKEGPIMDFEAFDTTEIERLKTQYAEEVKARWGHTPAYAGSERRTQAYDGPQWAAVTEAGEAILQAFADRRGSAPDSPEAQALVGRWRAHITANFYQCTGEILAGLGEMYTCDQRFRQSIDRRGKGTAAFMSSAIAAYCRSDSTQAK